MTNKPTITQEELYKKVKEIVNDKIKNDYLLHGISPEGVTQMFSNEEAKLKKQYDIK